MTKDEMNMESKIIIETEHFYAYTLKLNNIEIRKKNENHSYVIGTVKTKEIAERFINRAEKYPNNF